MARALYLRSSDWHYIVYPERKRHELYDLRVDPQENHNVARENRERLRTFRARITKWRERMEAMAAP